MRGFPFVLLCAAAACAIASAATTVGTLTPRSGTTGTKIAISGFGFTPTHSTKVEFVPSPPTPGLKTLRAKVLSVAGGEIDVELVKGVPANYAVRLTPAGKGGGPVDVAVPFVLGVPTPTSTDPTSGPSGTPITVHGTIGADKGAVTIGGKSAKVLNWVAGAATVVVPKLSAGDQAVVVRNKAGSSTASLSFTVVDGSTSSGGGGEYLRGDVTGYGKLDIPKSRFKVDFFAHERLFLIVGAAGSVMAPESLSVGVTDPFSLPPPYTVGAVPAALGLPYSQGQFILFQNQGLVYTGSASYPASTFSVTVTSWDGTYFAGNFGGNLVTPTGTTVTVSNGAFRAKVTMKP